jgi:5'-methylthioadenosine phosphorylase
LIDLGIIGGTGFYEFFEQRERLEVGTRYGDPSSPVTVADWGGKRIGFVARHGERHQYLPHRVPYSANIAALRELGARQILGFNVIGSLSPKIDRGHFVLIDQFIDLTWGRSHWTVFDRPGGAHADVAEPYCARSRADAAAALADCGETVHTRATAVVINGPRFQTKAESRLYAAWGGDVINMTQSTEASVARELEACYVNLSYCTDNGVIAGELHADRPEPPILHREIVAEFQRNRHRIEPVMRTVVEALRDDPSCPCLSAMDGCLLQAEEPDPHEAGSAAADGNEGGTR